MPESHPSVETFVNETLQAGSDRLSLVEAYTEYQSFAEMAGFNRVPEERFRWHLEEALPPIATWTTDEDVVGVCPISATGSEVLTDG